jgi:hypothetical protein
MARLYKWLLKKQHLSFAPKHIPKKCRQKKHFSEFFVLVLEEKNIMALRIIEIDKQQFN